MQSAYLGYIAYLLLTIQVNVWWLRIKEKRLVHVWPTCLPFQSLDITTKIIIIASHEDEMNDKYNDKLCTSNEVISEMREEI